MPAVLLVLFISILPLILSLYLSLVHLVFVKGGFKLNFVGLGNYARMLVGFNQPETLGVATTDTWLAWLIFALLAAGAFYLLLRYARGQGASTFGLVMRTIVALIGLAILWLVVFTLLPGGRPGALAVTLLYVVVDITVQYAIGLLLAMLCLQHIAGRRFQGAFSDPHDDHPGGRGLPVPHADGHGKRAFAANLECPRAAGFLLGEHSLGGAGGGDDRRHLAVGTVHVHRPAGSARIAAYRVP